MLELSKMLLKRLLELLVLLKKLPELLVLLRERLRLIEPLNKLKLSRLLLALFVLLSSEKLCKLMDKLHGEELVLDWSSAAATVHVVPGGVAPGQLTWAKIFSTIVPITDAMPRR
jgi:hypothetical protein